MLPDEDGGVQLWCWLLFGQVQSSDRSGPQHCNCWSTSSCSLLHEDLEQHCSQHSWGIILFAEPSFCCYSLKARHWPGTSIATARIRPLHTLEWQLVLSCWGALLRVRLLLCSAVCTPVQSQCAYYFWCFMSWTSFHLSKVQWEVLSVSVPFLSFDLMENSKQRVTWSPSLSPFMPNN